MTKKELFAGWNERMFLDDPAAVAAYCRKYWPEECSHIIRVADEVCRGYFLFDLKWDMERTWEPVVFPEGKVDWEYKPGDDPEFIYQLTGTGILSAWARPTGSPGMRNTPGVSWNC